MASKELRVPDLGNFSDVAVIDVLVQPGQAIEVDTPLITLETEKATMDVPSTDAGVIEKLHLNKGARVSAGSLIATVNPAAGAEPQPSATTGTPSFLASATALCSRFTSTTNNAAGIFSNSRMPSKYLCKRAPSRRIAACSCLT